ncbi:PLP-dependent aminotransferase family protein [Kiloniella laminariae]|uniref:aminotransferase-like domain-containing protein n=1 Tax=Kiloniella laminariae TaxID=454162 RepID=UPI00037D7D1C|nr:PLP-dependent aminotransferase family protein [Kiloniella laminariae]
MWVPQNLDPDLSCYRAITECLVRDISSGRLADGDKLPPMRELADHLGVTVGTVLRAYNLAEQRGILVKQTGRGSFVRKGKIEAWQKQQLLDETGTVDLSRNAPPFINLEALLRRSLMEISRDSNLDGMLEYGQSQGLQRHREILCQWLGGRGFTADPSRIIITGGAQQALTTALGALTSPGDTVLVEELSYPGIKNFARFFGINLVPVALDDGGLLPSSVEQACLRNSVKALYCMPFAHNPTTATMSEERRADIAGMADRYGFYVVEDDVNPRPFSSDFKPIAALNPERTIYISSLSKTISPGLRVGILMPPAALLSQFLAASQTTSWMAPPLMAEVACHWIKDGTATELEHQRATITANLLDQAAQSLVGIPYRHNAATSHLWLPLSGPWKAVEFAEALSNRGVRVSPSELFAVDPVSAPSGVRINLTNIGEERLRKSLSSIVELWNSKPQATNFQM